MDHATSPPSPSAPSVPARGLTAGWFMLACVAVVFGFQTRERHLADRPLHADEAVQAWQTWKLLKGDGYRYDPVDRHGPLLYYGSAAWHQLTAGTADNYSDARARGFVLLAGFATLLLLGTAGGLPSLSPPVFITATALLATETLSTLYHTYFVQEAWLALFVWGFLLLLLSWRERDHNSVGWPVSLGLCAGLAQCTKETTPLYLVIAIGAVWVAQGKTIKLPGPRAIAAAAIGALLPYTLLYSGFGSNFEGLIDGVRTYGLQAERLSHSPHHYPWWHYLKTLGVLPTGGPNWGQYTLLALAGIGGVLAFRRKAAAYHRAIAIFTVGTLLVHSVISYKTPWLLLTPVIGLVLLAAVTLVWLGQRSRWRLALAIAIGLATCGENLRRGHLALDRYPGDARNPYFYQQTPRPFMRLVNRATQLQNVLDRPLTIAVVSEEHAWPLPWYWRDHDATGYFETAPDNFAAWDMVVWDPQVGDAPPALDSEYVAELHGLRPGVVLQVYIADPVWHRLFPPLGSDPS